MHHQFNSHSQLLNCLKHRLAEFIHRSPIHPAVKGSADVGTSQSKVNIFYLVAHGVLYMFVNNQPTWIGEISL